MTTDNTPTKQESTDSGLDQTQIKDIMEKMQSVLNPNGENPQVGEYIMSSFQYIMNALTKMQQATDKDAAAKEIADDLSQKFDNWVKSRAAKLQQEEQEKKDQQEQEKQKLDEPQSHSQD